MAHALRALLQGTPPELRPLPRGTQQSFGLAEKQKPPPESPGSFRLRVFRASSVLSSAGAPKSGRGVLHAAVGDAKTKLAHRVLDATAAPGGESGEGSSPQGGRAGGEPAKSQPAGEPHKKPVASHASVAENRRAELAALKGEGQFKELKELEGQSVDDGQLRPKLLTRPSLLFLIDQLVLPGSKKPRESAGVERGAPAGRDAPLC